MAKALRIVGQVAGVVAVVAPLIPGGQTIGLIAAAVSVAANIGAQLLAKKPPARGTVNNITIGTDQPMPIPLGTTYYGGARQHQTGYGPTLKKVPNPYAFIADVYSGVTIAGFRDYLADFVSLGVAAAGGAATGYAGGFLWVDSLRGAVPEARALQPHYAGAPNWGADYKLSGEAAVGWSLLFDRDGKVFASGVPQLGVTLDGALGYDPRKDTTYPGGVGAHRIADEATREWSDNPAIMALTYALGWKQQGQKVAGVGIPPDGLVLGDFVALANVCTANAWKVGGVVFEPALASPSTRWQNLKDILAAGGAEPCFKGGRLGLKISAPRIALDTITEADLADGEIVVGAMQGWENRLNTLIPKYRSAAHKWEYVQSDPVTIASYVAEDGEVKREERQFNLVQDKDQAAQLAAYELLDRRELGEIEVRCKPRLRRYGPGDLLVVDIPEAGLAQQPCVILKRSIDPASMTVSFTLRGETAAKHAFALGRTGIAPPTPAIGGTAALDAVAAPVPLDRSAHAIIAQTVQFPVTTTATSIMVAGFRGTLDDQRIIDFPAGQIDGLDDAASYRLFYALEDVAMSFIGTDGQTFTGDGDQAFGSVIPAGTYYAAPADSVIEATYSGFAIIRIATTANADGVTYPAPAPTPAGDGGTGYGGGGRYQQNVQQA